jgi:RNA-binding protein
MPTPSKLPGKQLRFLRALAHEIKPTVQIGKQGLSDAVCAQVEQALLDHELIKVKLGSECPDDLPEVATQISARLSAHIAQSIGLTLVLYKRHPTEPKIQLPRVKSTDSKDK